MRSLQFGSSERVCRYLEQSGDVDRGQSAVFGEKSRADRCLDDSGLIENFYEKCCYDVS